MSQSLDVTFKLITAESQLSRHFSARLGSLHGLSLGDLAILINVRQAPGGRVRRTDLAERLGLSQSGVTRALLPLERIGLLRRQAEPRDGRVSYVALTRSGERVLGHALETAKELSAEVFGRGWSGSELEQLDLMLSRLGGVGVPA